VGLADEAQALLAALREEAAEPAVSRGTRASDYDLDVAIAGVQSWIDGRTRQTHLARIVTDNWTLDDALSERVVRFARMTADDR
jgi:hypothetical protein